MRDDATLTGISGAEALRRIVEMKRFDAEAPMGGSVSSASDLAMRLRACGVDARHVRIETPEDFGTLALPAAAALPDGTWLILRRRARKALRVVTADGERTASHRSLSDAGIRTDSSTFSFDSRGSNAGQFAQQQQQQGGHGQPRHAPSPFRDTDGGDAAPSPYRQLRTSGRVDLMA